MEKLCSRCNILQSDDQFRKGKKQCKSCIKQIQKELYLKNREDRILKSTQYAEKNHDKVKQYHKKRYAEQRHVYKEKAAEYYDQNKDYIIQKVANYRKVNRDVINLKRRSKKYHLSPEAKIRRSLHNRLNKIVKYKAIRIYDRAIDFLGCTPLELKSYLESKFLPTMSWENHGSLWHIDHIIPCAHFDLTKEEDQKKCFHYTNLQPLFATTTIINGITYIGNLNKKSKII